MKKRMQPTMSFSVMCMYMNSITYKGAKNFWSLKQSARGKRITLEVWIFIADRDNGEETRLFKKHVMDWHEICRMTPHLLIRRTRDLIHYLEIHEADEQFLFDDRRLFDPHADVI
jgi:hypothetical protein